MLARIRALIESILYFGLQPGKTRPLDPFYVTNRSWLRKLLYAVLMLLPVAIVLAMVLLLPPRQQQPGSGSNHAPLPAAARRLDVVEVSIQTGEVPPILTGSVRNLSEQRFASVELSFNVLDRQGTLLGAVSTTVNNLGPRQAAAFRVPVTFPGASIALVRDVQGR